MPQTKISGKFYPLTSDVTTKLRRAKLTAAEWRIWSYLVEIDPWGDRYRDIDSLDVMSKCDCSRATFYRAIAKLQKFKIFDIQDQGFCIRNLTGASSLKSGQEEEQDTKFKKDDLKNETEFSKMRLDSQNCDSDLKNETGFSKMRLDSQNCENKPPETPPDKAFEIPKTLQTYSDFKKTLSEGEREKFFNFVEEKIKNLEKPINDLEAWLASQNAAKQNRWEVYYSNYQEQKISESVKTTKQNQGSEKLSPSEMQRAIAEFKKQRKINQPVDESEPEVINSQTYQRQQAELNKLLDNPPEYDKSLAQQHREKIAEAKRQQSEWKRANKEAAAERAKQQNPDLEQRRAEIQRQIEEFNQRQLNQNPETEDNTQINPKNLENE